MPLNSVNYQCPSCMGPLNFDGSTGLVRCDYCGQSYDPQEIEAYHAAKQQAADERGQQQAAQAAAGQRSAFDQMGDEAAGSSAALTQETIDAASAVSAQAANPIEAYLSRASWNDAERDGLRSYTCASCGAALTVDATTAIEECPYCGNQAMAPGTFAGGARPEFVIPFKVGKNDAVSALEAHYKGKRFLPKEFIEGNRIAHVQGVYVPFWLYDGTVQGGGSFEAKNIHTWREGDTQVTKTDVYRAWREGWSSFVRIPADGSSKMPNGHMDAVEPFDYTEMQPFSPAYLPGFSAERYDEGADACAERAHKRMQQTLAKQLEDTVVGYDQVGAGQVSSTSNVDHVSQALLPVWMLHTRYDNEDYLFAMNGQTGRFIGDLPVSPLKVVLWFLGIFLAVFAVCFGLDATALHVSDTFKKVVIDFGVPLLAAGGVCWYFYSQMKTAKEKTTAFDYVAGGGIHLTNSSDVFITSFTTRHRVQTSNNND